MWNEAICGQNGGSWKKEGEDGVFHIFWWERERLGERREARQCLRIRDQSEAVVRWWFLSDHGD